MASSATLQKLSPNQSKQVYQPPQQVQYLYLEAEIDVLLRQLQAKKNHN